MSVIREVVEVDPARRAQWLMPSGIRCVDPDVFRYLLPVDPMGRWRQGDLILAEVLGPVGQVTTVQNTSRRAGLDYRDASLFPGTKLVAVLAPRAGSSTCLANVPEHPVEEIHLHGVGGQAGLVDVESQHTALYRGAPTKLRVLAELGDGQRRRVNMRAFGQAVSDEPRRRTADDPALILIVGSDMDAGKTSTARRVIYSLRAMGHKIVAGKATGVGSLYDIASMFDAGATEVFDFAELGEPVTIGLSREEVLSVFHRVVNHLRAKAGADGYMVLELADGIWYRETRFLLEDEGVRDLVSHVVLACHGILDAENGVSVLNALGYGPKLRAISGKLASSGLLRSLAATLLSARLPVFDALDYASHPESVADLFAQAKSAAS